MADIENLSPPSSRQGSPPSVPLTSTAWRQ